MARTLTDDEYSKFQELDSLGGLTPSEQSAFRELVRKRGEDPGVVTPQVAPGQGSPESEAVSKMLLEAASMVTGAGAGGKLALKGAEWGVPKIASLLRSEPRFIGITPRGAELTGRVTGSGVGGGAGAVLGDVLLPPPDHERFELPKLKTFGRGFGEGLTAETGGLALMKGLDKLALEPLSKYMAGTPKTGLKAEDAAVWKNAQDMGVTLRPAEITADDVAAQVQMNAQRSMFGKDRFQALDLKNEQAFRKVIDEYADTTFDRARTDQTHGQLIQRAIQGGQTDFSDVTRAMYGRLRESTKGEKIIDTGVLLPQMQQLTRAINKDVHPKTYAVAKEIEDQISETGYTTGLRVSQRFTPDVVTPGPVIPTGMTVKETTESLRGPTTGLHVTRMEGQAPQGSTLSGKPIEPPLRGLRIRDVSEGAPVEGSLQRLQATTRYTKLPDATEPGRLGGLKIETRSEGPAKPKPLDFMEAHDLRSKLLSIGRIESGLPDYTQAVAGRLAKTLDHGMEKAAKKFDSINHTKVYPDWRVANASTKAGHELYDDAIIQRAVTSHPEDMVKVAFKKYGDTETDKVMQTLVNNPEAVNTYRRAALEMLIQKANVDDVLHPRSLYVAALGKNGIGESVMEKTFKEHWPKLKQILKVGERMDLAALPSKVGTAPTARGLVNWFEQSMLLQVPTALARNLIKGDIGAGLREALEQATNSGTYIFTIRELARVLNDPQGVSMLMRGLHMRPDFAKTAAGAQFLVNLLTIATGDELERRTKGFTELPSMTMPKAFQLQQ